MNLLNNSIKEVHITYCCRRQQASVSRKQQSMIGVFVGFYPNKYNNKYPQHIQRKDISLLRMNIL